jgi:uncharacterized protein (TIGR02099 family)
MQLAITQLQQRFNWRKQDTGWQWLADHLTLNTTARDGGSVAFGREPMRPTARDGGSVAFGREPMRPDQLQLTNAKVLLQGVNTAPSTLRRVEMQIPQLDLQVITQLSQFFDAPFPMPALQGQLKQFSLALTPETQEFAVQGSLDKVSLPANKDFPGISNLSAQLQGNQQQGAIELDIQNTALDLPKIFAKPLPLNALHAHFDWQQDSDGWVLNSPDIALAVPDLQADSRLQLKVNRQTHAVWMDLQTAFKGSSDIKSFGRYWPTGLMGKEAVDWLNQAFAKGRVKPQGLLFSGALADFPFQHKQGVFELILDFNDIDLQYAADWEPVQAIDAQVLFYNDGMQIAAERASVRGAALQQFDLSLPSFQSSPYISVNVKGAGDIMQTLGYLQHSPVKNSVEHLLQIITPHGLSPINLSIQVPLSDQAGLKIKGDLQLQNVRLNVVPLTLPVSNLQGTIDFNEQGVVGGQLQARALGDNVKVALKNNAESMQLDILGHADIVDIQQQFSAALWQYAQGDSDYELNVNLPNDNRIATLSLKSDLTGIALKLPEPLAKRAATARPFRLQMNLGAQSLLPVNIQFDKQLQMSALLNVKEKTLSAAQLLIGTGELDAVPSKGGVLTLNVERCALDDWLALADSATSGDTAVTPFFEHIKLRTKQALWQNQALGPLSLQLHHEYQTWKMELDSPLLKGRIRSASDPTLDKPTLLDLDYVNLSALTQLNTTAPQKPENKRLPLFNLTAQQVVWNGMNVGVLALETERIANGIAFKQLSLKNAQGGLNLTGSWTVNAAEQRTELTGNLTLREFGGFLSSMQISRDLKATALSAALNLHWAGGPHNVALERLNGRVDLELKNGRILSIEPGFGRLLGFLAFEQWGRRLRLDFSDMLAEGLTFNRIYGRFDLQHGDALTHNLVVDAVPAEVNISGVAHLAERTLDYHAKVLPKSSAALPIAGTIVDRILTYSLETITGTSQAGFLMGSEYKILGQWQDLQVIRLREKDGLLQKTWYGLTDFSWLQNKTISKNQQVPDSTGFLPIPVLQ